MSTICQLISQLRVDPEEPRTVLGSFRIKDGRLIVETNSRERAARIEGLLAGRFKKLLAIEKTLYRHLDVLRRMLGLLPKAN